MTIAALPRETARKITSTLALNDAVAVVKELIDNALDACADAISIEVSANTLDLIQVKDNGFGIGVEDRQLLCKRGCTSKIRSIDDLAALGGSFLGFRGEALASVAEISNSVTITTRIEGEVVGSTLKFGSDGKLLSSSSASHPVGTTVRIQDFLSRVPVRRQTAVKAASTTITNIRKLLQSYAFARSAVRISFKVPKARDEKSNWSFAPVKSAEVLSEAATKIVGKIVTDQCSQHSVNSELDAANQAQWRLETLLISPNSDVQKACHSSQTISVDQRPVSAERDLMKTLTKTYKTYLRHSIRNEAASSIITRPFLLVRISCPPDTYDVNVEPAKDEVLFYNPDILTSLFDKLMQDVYGTMKADRLYEPGLKVAKTSAPSKKFDLLLVRNPSRPNLVATEAGNQNTVNASRVDGLSETDFPSITSNPVARHHRDCQTSAEIVTGNLTRNSGFGGGDDKVLHIDQEEAEETVDTTDDANVRNPWSLAKLNVRFPTKQLWTQNAITPSSTQPVNNNQSSGSPACLLPNSSKEHELYQNPGPPLRRRAPRMTESDDESTISLASIDETRPGNNLIDSWVKKVANIRRPQADSVPDIPLPHDQTSVHHANSRGAQKTLPSPRRTSPIRGSQSVNSHQQRLSLAFKSPFKQASRLQQDNDSPTIQHLQTPPPSESRSELDEILYFERQKKLAIAQRRKQLAAMGNRNSALVLPSPPTLSLGSDSEGVDSRPAARTASTTAAGLENDFESRFGSQNSMSNVPVQRKEPRSNPHINRYLAATRNLDRSDPHSSSNGTTHAHPLQLVPGQSLVATEADLNDDVNEIPKIPISDPRGYFMHHRQSTAPNPGIGGLSKTGLKIRRTKTTRLPLETTPVDASTCDLAVDVDVEKLTNREIVMERASALGNVDEYVKTGRIDSVERDVNDQEVILWEEQVQDMVKRRYRSAALHDVDDGNSGRDAGNRPCEFKIDLRTAFKAALDEVVKARRRED